MEQHKRYREITVIHPEHGETTVKGMVDKLDAAVEAARRWHVQWSMLAKEALFLEGGKQI